MGIEKKLLHAWQLCCVAKIKKLDALKEEWSQYLERIDNFFAANDTEETD